MKKRWVCSFIITVVCLVVSASADELNLQRYIQQFDTLQKEQGNQYVDSPDMYPWGESGVLLSYARVYLATGDTSYLKILEEHITRVLANRDDRRGIHDYRGKSFPGWSTTEYTGGKRYIFPVHTGMITYPIAMYCRAVIKNKQLWMNHLEKALRTLWQIEESIAMYDEQWRNGPNPGEGYYVHAMDAPFQNSRGAGTQGSILPLNRQSAMGRAILELYLITGKQRYLDRVSKIASYLKNCFLRLPNNSYAWDYHARLDSHNGLSIYIQPALDKFPVKSYSHSELKKMVAEVFPSGYNWEDISHASINISFAFQCYQNGIIFTDEDMQRLCNTLLLNILGQPDKAAPRVFGEPVPFEENRYLGAISNWLELAGYHPDILKQVLVVLPNMDMNMHRLASIIYAIFLMNQNQNIHSGSSH